MKYLSLSVPGYGPIDAPGNIPTGGMSTSGKAILKAGINAFLVAAVLLALFFLIWGGIQWSTSQGDKDKLEAAKKRVVFSIIGLLVSFFSFVILQVLGAFFKVPLLG